MARDVPDRGPRRVADGAAVHFPAPAPAVACCRRAFPLGACLPARRDPGMRNPRRGLRPAAPPRCVLHRQSPVLDRHLHSRRHDRHRLRRAGRDRRLADCRHAGAAQQHDLRVTHRPSHRRRPGDAPARRDRPDAARHAVSRRHDDRWPQPVALQDAAVRGAGAAAARAPRAAGAARLRRGRQGPRVDWRRGRSRQRAPHARTPRQLHGAGPLSRTVRRG